jgi:hypothetical protein
MITRLRSQTWDDLLESALVIGSPETVADKIAQLEAAGVGEVGCWMNFGGLPPEKVRRSMRLFAEEVIPVGQTQLGRLLSLVPPERRPASGGSGWSWSRGLDRC